MDAWEEKAPQHLMLRGGMITQDELKVELARIELASR